MSTHQRVSFGVKTAVQHTTYEDMLQAWLAADAEPIIEHAWLNDHVLPPDDQLAGTCLESWTLLAALASQTKRLRLGIMVTSNTFRHPALLAKMAATIDRISQGRLELGIGAGWNKDEHNAYGIPLYAPGERIRRLDEACELIKRMWTETAPSFNGTYYQTREAYCEPKPLQQPYPPFVIGGNGEQLMLRLVARHANIWNFVAGDPETFQHKNAVLDDHCSAIGRDPSTIERSVQLTIDPDDLKATRAQLQRFISTGATHVVLYLPPPYSAGIIHRLVKEVIGPLQEKTL